MHPTFERAMAQPIQANVLVALCDWRLFFQLMKERGSIRMFADLHEFYLLTEDHVQRTGGLVIKFMGDSALAIYPQELAGGGIMALMELKRQVDAWFKRRGINSWLYVNAHYGEVTLGPMGRSGRLDVIGDTVNITATLGSKSFALSQQAFRCLSPEHRRLFHRFTQPVLYIPEAGALEPAPALANI